MVARASHSCQQKQFDQSERCSVRDLGTRINLRAITDIFADSRYLKRPKDILNYQWMLKPI